jgi:hypothetical protein
MRDASVGRRGKMNRRIAMTNIECLLAERIRKLAERRKRDRVPPACPWAREDYMQRMRALRALAVTHEKKKVVA